MWSNKYPLALLAVVLAFFVWSALEPHDTRLTWVLETLPFMIALPVLTIIASTLKTPGRLTFHLRGHGPVRIRAGSDQVLEYSITAAIVRFYFPDSICGVASFLLEGLLCILYLLQLCGKGFIKRSNLPPSFRYLLFCRLVLLGETEYTFEII